MQLSHLDLWILIVYLLATVAFGAWLGRGQRTANDYLRGGRNLPWWALLLSIVATETSTASFLSVPGIACHGLPGTTGDLRYLQLPLGYILGRVIAARLLLPLYFRGELFTAYEVLRQRSGPAVRTLSSGLFLVTRTLADGLRLCLSAMVLQLMLGWSLPASVLALGGATMVYTVIGGIRAVVWTDVVQFLVYILGAVLALLLLTGRLPGGLPGLAETAAAEGRLRVFDFALDPGNPYTFWAGLIGGAVLSIGSHGTDQIIVQRYLSARSLVEAQRALRWSGPIVLLQFSLFLVIGLGLAQFFQAHPPTTAFERSDRVFAWFIVHELPTGVVGIVLGAVFSAAMSTLSSSLSASAGALVNDFVLPATGRAVSSPFALRTARAATLLFALLQIGVALSGMGGAAAIVNQVLAIANVTTGIILGLFVLALSPRRSNRASLGGLLAGIVATVVVLFVLPHYDLAIAWPWYGLVTCTSTCLVGFSLRALGHPDSSA